MTYSDALLLGLVQGITEFLPVSSTGHLVLLREVLGLQSEYGLAVDATLHFATALAVILYFRKDLKELLFAVLAILNRKPVIEETKILLYALALGTVPAVCFGLLFEEQIETVFRDPARVAWVLILGSLLFVLAERVHTKLTEKKEFTLKKGIWIGFFQVLALVPGMSRSGATISGGMLLGLTRERAARFAFLLSIPIILGAGSMKLFELGGAGMSQNEWGTIMFGACIAFIAGILSIHYLLRFLKNHTLYVFVLYRVLLALAVLLVA